MPPTIPTDENTDKQLSFETAYARGKVRVLFDMDVEGVLIPEIARKRSQDKQHLCMDYSRLFHMPKFKITDLGIQADLVFSGRTHMTFVPWGAVRAVIQSGVILDKWFIDEGSGASAAPFIATDMDLDTTDKWTSLVIAEG